MSGEVRELVVRQVLVPKVRINLWQFLLVIASFRFSIEFAMKRANLLATACCVLLVSGCGLEDYEARMANSLVRLQEMTRYESLYGPTQLDIELDGETVHLPITICLPNIPRITNNKLQEVQWFRENSAYGSEEVKTVPEHILYPPFLLEFPGFNRTGQGWANSNPQTLHSYYCYIGVVESRAAKFESVLTELRKKTAAKLPQTSQWQDVICKDRNLVATTWKMFEAKGKQKFAQKSGSYNEASLDAEGTFRVYAREDQGYIVLFGVRIPDALASEVYLLDLADAVVGTVKITEPAPTGPVPPPKPKTKKPADDMPPADETPTEVQPGATMPDAPAEKGGEKGGDKGTAKPPVEEEDWSSEKNDHAPAEMPTEEQPPAENADPAMPETAPNDEGTATDDGAAEPAAEGEMPAEETPEN